MASKPPTMDLARLSTSADARVRALVELIRNGDETQLALLCDRAGLTVEEIERGYVKAQVSTATAVASNHAARVFEDIARDARSGRKACPDCGGLGKINDETCPVCKGQKVVRRVGDRDARKQYLEILGIGSKGPMVALQINNGPGGIPSLEDTLRHAGKVADGSDAGKARSGGEGPGEDRQDSGAPGGPEGDGDAGGGDVQGRSPALGLP